MFKLHHPKDNYKYETTNKLNFKSDDIYYIIYNLLSVYCKWYINFPIFSILFMLIAKYNNKVGNRYTHGIETNIKYRF